MYHFFVRRRVRAIFAHLNAGDFGYVTRQFAADATHWFSGRHALGGQRRTGATRAAWYRRLATVMPGLAFTIEKIVVSGPPWRTHVAVEWRDRVFDPQGRELEPNQGVFVLALRWGRAVDFRVYCDTQGLARNLDAIAARGVPEAADAPLADPQLA